ncbi:MAG: septum formation initiator family protein [Ilumatobacteraceae bacterium]
MSGSHKTSAIPRAGRAAAPVRRHRSRRDRDRTLLDDLTRPIEPEHRLVTGRSNRWLLGLLTVGVVGALLAALFVLPVQAWMRQQDEIAVKEQELEVLTEANRELSADVQHLETVEGAREAAREQLGVVDRGEERISVMPPGSAPLPLPTGWPYDAITQIVAVRTTPPVTVPPPTTAPATVATAPATTVASAPGTSAPADQAPVNATP